MTFLHFQSHSQDCPSDPLAKQLPSERAVLKQQSKVSLTAQTKPISRQGAITQMGIFYSFLWPGLMRLERLYTPPTLTHPCTCTPTHAAPLDKGGSSKSSHLTLYWSNRAVGMEKEGCPPTQTADLPEQKHNMREAFRETCYDRYLNLNINPTPDGFWVFFEKLENKIQDWWGKTSQSL